MGLMRTPIAAVLGILFAMTTGAHAAGPGRNLLANGGFEKGTSDTDEPAGWHTRITGVIPVPEYTDPANKRGRTGVNNFRCGCGHDWGPVRPWAMLVCPNCERLNPGLEDSGGLYQQNESYVDLVAGRSGKAARLTLPEAIGNNQGVRVVSDLIKARRGAGYEIAVDAAAEGSHLRVFVEGFRKLPVSSRDSQWLAGLPAKANPLRQKARLERVFRKQINVGTPASWQRFSEKFVAPSRYQFDVMFVTLYAYLPGKAAYDNVVLRELNRAELRDYLREHPGPKDRRLR